MSQQKKEKIQKNNKSICEDLRKDVLELRKELGRREKNAFQNDNRSRRSTTQRNTMR